jgi:uncharacterized membrane protein
MDVRRNRRDDARSLGVILARIPLSLSLAKAGSFAVVHFAVAFTVAYLLTGSFGIAGAIALIEPLANTIAYLLHERAWARFTPAQARPQPGCCGLHPSLAAARKGA